jgi:hypothetical protein
VKKGSCEILSLLCLSHCLCLLAFYISIFFSEINRTKWCHWNKLNGTTKLAEMLLGLSISLFVIFLSCGNSTWPMDFISETTCAIQLLHGFCFNSAGQCIYLWLYRNINKKPHFRETTNNQASDAESDVTLVDHIQFNIHSWSRLDFGLILLKCNKYTILISQFV